MLFHMTLIFVFSLCTLANEEGPSFFNQSQLKKLKQHVSGHNLIFLGEDHESMGDRSNTYEFVYAALQVRPQKQHCLFIEVPTKHQSLLDNYYIQKNSYEAFLKHFPKSLHKMVSKPILDLQSSKKISIYFMDHPGTKKSIDDRNKYMADFIKNTKSCQIIITVNGARHLIDTTSSRGKSVPGLGRYFQEKPLNIYFLPDYRQKQKVTLHTQAPQFYINLIDNPRSGLQGNDWLSFDLYITVPQ